MSELSYLGKLLDGVEVEWKMLGEVIHSLKTGLNPRQNFSLNTLDAQGYYVTVREIQNGKVVFLDKTDRVNDRALKIINGRSNLEAGDILFSGTGTVGRIAVIEENPINWNIKEGVYTIKPIKEKIAPRFLSYLLQSSKIVKDYSKKIVGNPVISLPMGDLKKLLIPIPCPDNPEKSLAIQSEIVRILDKFTALTAELTAELNMRKKQYNYYRDQLLSFKESEVEWKTLGEVAVIGTGNHDTQDAIEHGKYIFYARGREPLKLNVFDFDETAIITAGDGAGVGKVFHYAKGKYALHQRAYRIVPNAFMNPRFVYHYITAYFFTYIQKASVSSSVTSLRRPMFLKFPIPVPPSEEQARIVEILDKFDTLTNSITEGLPREIELRQKQYEYYRDLLFSFPKPETVSN
ncbi:TPA: restriction endonuclease subunit S [Escherichia coli]|uniref:restriction endonuclease subunit S n=1 Tax=Escherichia coli TaxID=562 RepID=UPI00069977CC|nr:restriction endonuclease subunit S [Escherichia coli]EJC1902018.1 restriction endonuclease subunit S [Escherichia coli]VTR24497.1 type I restriction-modification enzyme S subunit [Escherichia coli]HAI2273910.1 restriction endonuclease subunit S [Escherichia coli]HDY6420738.1 restriction endonuclease subunit S [Escherichia coli]HDY6425710.1 restriction endonuclease subunit S [Escherichia coli]